MKLLIQKAHIVQPGSPFHLKQHDLLIEDGTIVSIGDSLDANDAKVITSPNLHVSPGWFDLKVQFCDPGFEEREDLMSGIQAAANGGFTEVTNMPFADPVIDSKSGIDYIKNKTLGSIVTVHPVGAISKGLKGQDLAELYDMHQSGAVAFSDGKDPLQNAGLLKRALLYTKGFDGLVMHFPYEKNIAPNGIMHEGYTSTTLGLKGIPGFTEEIMVARDLALLEYTDSRIHFSTLSTAASIELIREAKKRGAKVTCDVAAHQLILDETSLISFDSNFKVMPPLRRQSDIKALIAGIKDGTIDAICSDHQPHNEENKKRELDHADFGINGLETVFAALNTHCGISIETLVEKLALAPRTILGIPIPEIQEENPANLTLFDPSIEWECTSESFFSKAKNNPFLGSTLKGKTLGIVNNGSSFLN